MFGRAQHTHKGANLKFCNLLLIVLLLSFAHNTADAGNVSFGIKAGLNLTTITDNRGFTNVITSGDFEINGNTETIDADDIKNQGLAFLLGYVF
jgi:hypothetical protein